MKFHFLDKHKWIRLTNNFVIPGNCNFYNFCHLFDLSEFIFNFRHCTYRVDVPVSNFPHCKFVTLSWKYEYCVMIEYFYIYFYYRTKVAAPRVSSTR